MPLNLGHINTARAALNRASWHKYCQENYPNMLEARDLPLLKEIPKPFETPNYVVEWKLDSTSHRKAAFASFDEALKFAKTVQSNTSLTELRILRSGPHPSAPSWKPTKRTTGNKRINWNTTELVTQEDAWIVPEGYVDTEADKHGPLVYVPRTTTCRTDAEKASWYRDNQDLDKHRYYL